jgi:hypothetical protein
LIEGPDNNYKIAGWSQYEISTGFSGANVNVLGHKWITFKDGHKVKINAPGDFIYNILMGTMGH